MMTRWPRCSGRLRLQLVVQLGCCSRRLHHLVHTSSKMFSSVDLQQVGCPG